jgi:hypothetical protein
LGEQDTSALTEISAVFAPWIHEQLVRGSSGFCTTKMPKIRFGSVSCSTHLSVDPWITDARNPMHSILLFLQQNNAIGFGGDPRTPLPIPPLKSLL